MKFSQGVRAMDQQEVTVAKTRWTSGVRNSLNSGLMLNNEPTGFVDRLNVEYESKLRVKESFKAFCMFAVFEWRSWKNGVIGRDAPQDHFSHNLGLKALLSASPHFTFERIHEVQQSEEWLFLIERMGTQTCEEGLLYSSAGLVLPSQRKIREGPEDTSGFSHALRSCLYLAGLRQGEHLTALECAATGLGRLCAPPDPEDVPGSLAPQGSLSYRQCTGLLMSGWCDAE